MQFDLWPVQILTVAVKTPTKGGNNTKTQNTALQLGKNKGVQVLKAELYQHGR